ncbi:MAG: c-type cytochrome biogenesis protein CcmI [Methylococcaceae bacterium]|nr:c-type cytochrome biogenesis protein CcmI [Methylococcaceae bacterium]
MTALWLVFALLILLAFSFIFWPLLPFYRKNKFAHSIQKQQNIAIFHDRLHELEQERNQGTLEQTTFITLKTELEKTLLQDAQDQDDKELKKIDVSSLHWLIAISLCLTLFIVSLGMYFKFGRSDDLSISQAIAMAEQTQTGEHQSDSKTPPPNMEKSIALLESKIAQDPDNKEKLFLLANSYAAVNQFDKAAKIYEQMAKLVDPDSDESAGLKGAQAQALFQASEEKMTPEIHNLIKKALTIDPFEPSSLMLQGIDAFISNNYKHAITFWEKAKKKSGEEQVVRFINPAIKAAEQKLGITPTQVQEPQNQDSSISSSSVTIDLSLSSTLKSQVNDEQIIFVFARPAGGRMPLAAERIKVKDLPIRIVLDDTKAAMPTAKISSVDTVEVTARISLSGQLMPQKGDLFATVKNVVVKDNPTLALEINQIVK